MSSPHSIVGSTNIRMTDPTRSSQHPMALPRQLSWYRAGSCCQGRELGPEAYDCYLTAGRAVRIHRSQHCGGLACVIGFAD